MEIKTFPSLFRADDYSPIGTSDETSIGVPVKDGEKLSSQEILRRAVMIALGTSDAKQADEFIRQSGIQPRELAVKNGNGASFYEFPTDTAFYNSIEQFKRNGQAIPLNADKKEAQIIPDRQQNPNGANEKNVIDRAKIVRQNLEKGRIQNVQATTIEPNQVNGSTKPKPLTEKERNELRRRNNAIWEYTKQGLDGGKMQIPLSMKDLLEIKAAATDGDARLEVLTKALQKLGYSDEAIKSVLQSKNLDTDADSGTYLPGGTKGAREDVNDWLDKTIAEWRERQNINSIYFGTNPGGSTMTLDADLRKSVFLEDLRIREGENGVKLYKNQLELQKQIDEIEAKYKDRIKNSVNLLQESFLVNDKNDEIKQAIDRAYENSGIDFRSTQNESQIGANQTADTIEKIVRFGLEINPTTMFLPESVKNRIVNASIGIANGTVYLASAGQGAQDFITDKAIDALSYGANKIGIDTSSFDKALTQIRQARAERWQAYSNLQTANLSRLDAALADKIRRGLPLNATDIPSLERSLGKAIPQVALQAGIAVATGGASIPAQIAITASINGGIAFGATYAQTNNSWQATEEAAWNAAQTAVLPITAKIPGIGSEVVDLTTGYIAGKMRGANDVELLDQMLTQGLLGAGFKAGKKFADLTVQEKQQAWQRFRTIANEANKAVDAQYALAKNVFQNLKNGLKVSDAQAAEARQTLRQFTIQQEKAPNLYVGGLEPKIAKAITVLAADKIQKGITKFSDFASQMLNEAGTKVKPHLKYLYETYMKGSNKAVDAEGIKNFEIEQAKVQNAMRDLEDFRNDKDFPKYVVNKETGTVAFTKFDEPIFGTSPKILEKSNSAELNTLRLKEKRDLGNQTLKEIQTKLGALEGDAYGQGDAEFLTHAEAESIIRTAQKYRGQLEGKEIEVFVDRWTCGNCRQGLPLLIKLYGLEKATIYDSHGHKYVVDSKKTTKLY